MFTTESLYPYDGMSELDILSAVFLGMFQGVTEWLPISSSGQTVIPMVNALNMDAATALSFAFYLHFGTLMAVLLKLRGDVKHIIVRLPKVREDRMVQFIIISTIATAVVGIPVYLFLRSSFEGGVGGEIITALVGLFLVVTGVAIYLSKKRFGTRVIKDSNVKDSLFAGVAQGFAVIPGISRSGVTLAALIGNKMKQEDALRLSFLMSIPATIGVMILEGMTGSIASIGLLPVIAGILAAFIIGYIVIDVLLRFAKKARFDVFCVVFGLLAITIAAFVLM